MDKIVKHVQEAEYEDLPPAVIEVVKKTVVDTMGAALAGSSRPPAKMTAEMVKQWGGKEESSILVYGGRVPAPEAAMANCTISRCIELDDVHEGGGGHLSVATVPAAFALAESATNQIDGRKFILANAIASDLVCRLRMASMSPIGWMAETLHPFGAVAIAAKFLDLNEEQIRDAMGVAYMQCAGVAKSGGWSAWLCAGFAARAGITSALLAQKGYIGTRDPLLGTYGLYPLYFRDKYDESHLLGGLGKRWEIANVSLKPYPSCKFTHHPVYTALELVRAHDIKPGEIDEIIVKTSTYASTLVVYNERGEVKYVPRDSAEAHFSIPYTVAAAIIKGKLFIEELTDEAIKDSTTLALAKKVKIEIDPETDRLLREGKMLIHPTPVDIKTTNGKSYSGCEPFVKGHPQNPMSMDECIDKFMTCARLAAKPIPTDNLTSFVQAVKRLDKLDDVTSLIKWLT